MSNKQYFLLVFIPIGREGMARHIIENGADYTHFMNVSD